jgi:hypothetical protein
LLLLTVVSVPDGLIISTHQQNQTVTASGKPRTAAVDVADCCQSVADGVSITPTSRAKCQHYHSLPLAAAGATAAADGLSACSGWCEYAHQHNQTTTKPYADLLT